MVELGSTLEEIVEPLVEPVSSLVVCEGSFSVDENETVEELQVSLSIDVAELGDDERVTEDDGAQKESLLNSTEQDTEETVISGSVDAS
ncbi:MAG: hypothetical protein SGARI_007816 [Bacillariaceae sp.]